MKASIKDARRLFPATKKVKYFFNRGVCLIPTPVQSALRDFITQNESGFSDKNWKKWSGYLIEKLQDTRGVTVLTPAEKKHRAGNVTFLLKNHQQLYDELLHCLPPPEGGDEEHAMADERAPGGSLVLQHV